MGHILSVTIFRPEEYLAFLNAIKRHSRATPQVAVNCPFPRDLVVPANVTERVVAACPVLAMTIRPVTAWPAIWQGIGEHIFTEVADRYPQCAVREISPVAGNHSHGGTGFRVALGRTARGVTAEARRG